MARSKEELAVILTRKQTDKMFAESTWANLVSAIQAVTGNQKEKLVDMLVNGQSKKAGEALRNLLRKDAQVRAKAHVDSALADDSVSITELDDLL